MTGVDRVEESTQSFLNVWRTFKMSVLEGTNVVLNGNSVEGKPCINIDS